mmetsp:Transcript_158277/g.484934  ORF Transcript_158277/g.484934 Transcript_158277/m.484934 type:complete len:314 (+) Transcript_158277:91-1032(+)
MSCRARMATSCFAACAVLAILARLLSSVDVHGALPSKLEPSAGAPWTGGRLRAVFALTTTRRRLPLIRPVLDGLVQGQTRPLDAVYLALPPDVGPLPGWLERYNATSQRPGVLKILHMAADYGPASKLLAALREGGERSRDTVVIYGDDDVLYGSRVAELHLAAQSAAAAPAAFGTRSIRIGEGRLEEAILEATGSVSVRASALPEEAFGIGGMPDACRLSDDYWLSHYLARAGVKLKTLSECLYDFNDGTWPESCGTPFHALPEIEHIGALSSATLDPETGVGERSGGGDWRDQLRRYEVCQGLLEDHLPSR